MILWLAILAGVLCAAGIIQYFEKKGKVPERDMWESIGACFFLALICWLLAFLL